MNSMYNKSWLIGPIAFAAMLIALLITWALVEPAILVQCFDQHGFSPFELATLPFYAAIVPLVWWKCPFAGTPTRRRLLCLAVTIVAIMAIVKETDFHIVVLRMIYPDCVNASGGMAPGFFKPNGDPLTGTPFKMRVLTNAAVPFGLKAFVIAYFVAFFGVFAAGLIYLLPTWLKGVFRLDPASWAFGCCGASGVIVQISDRLPAWLGHAYGLTKSGTITAATSLCTCIEEGGELMLAVLALLTIYLGHRKISAAND